MPERNQYQIKTLTIDGKQVCASEDQTILEVARENGIDIPTLCHFSGLHAACALLKSRAATSCSPPAPRKRRREWKSPCTRRSCGSIAS